MAGVVNPGSLTLSPFFLIPRTPGSSSLSPCAHTRGALFFLFSTSPSFANELFTTRSRAQVREVLGSILGSAGGSSYHDGHLATGTSLTISHHTSLHHGCILIFSHALVSSDHPALDPNGHFPSDVGKRSFNCERYLAHCDK